MKTRYEKKRLEKKKVGVSKKGSTGSPFVSSHSTVIYDQRFFVKISKVSRREGGEGNEIEIEREREEQEVKMR